MACGTNYPNRHYASSFNEDDDITVWAGIVESIFLKSVNKRLLYIDIDSDSYPVILVDEDKEQEIRDLAEKMGLSISHIK